MEDVTGPKEVCMWTDIYKPNKVGDLVGNSGTID